MATIRDPSGPSAHRPQRHQRHLPPGPHQPTPWPWSATPPKAPPATAQAAIPPPPPLATGSSSRAMPADLVPLTAMASPTFSCMRSAPGDLLAPHPRPRPGLRPPRLDAAGQDLLYDQPDPAGHRAILPAPLGPAAPQPSSAWPMTRSGPPWTTITRPSVLMAAISPTWKPRPRWTTRTKAPDPPRPPVRSTSMIVTRDRYYRQPCPEALAAA